MNRRRYTDRRYNPATSRQEAYDSHTGMWVALAMLSMSQQSEAAGSIDSGISSGGGSFDGGGSSSSYDSGSSSSDSGSSSGSDSGSSGGGVD